MASNVRPIEVKGILDIEDGKFFVWNKETGERTLLSEFCEKYDGKNVAVKINCKE